MAAIGALAARLAGLGQIVELSCAQT